MGLIAGDANMCPEDFKKGLWFENRHVFIKVPGERVSIWRSKGTNGEFIERTNDHVVASHSLQGRGGGRFRIKTTQGAHFLGGKRQGDSGSVGVGNATSGKLPGRSNEGEGRGEEEEEEKEGALSRWWKTLWLGRPPCDGAATILAVELRETDATEGGVTQKAASAAHGTKVGGNLFSKSELGVRQKD